MDTSGILYGIVGLFEDEDCEFRQYGTDTLEVNANGHLFEITVRQVY